MDISSWRKNRETVSHPSTVVKATDLETARTNIEKHLWASSFLEDLLREVNREPDTSPDYLERMVPRETPNSQLFTMCAKCESAPVHGLYHWSADAADQLVCTTCKTTYPNEEFPEDFLLKTDFGGGQQIPYYVGKHWDMIGFPFVSSWSANIRARKCDHMARLARKLGLAFALTQKVEYAEKVRDILVRFATVYPGYMVHSGYGEFSDLDPTIASRNILALPEPELVVPPNTPDRKLHVGYWMAGRATGVGMEGTFLSDVVVAYDLTCIAEKHGQPVYTLNQKLSIEEDLLLEGTILLCADPGYNNKSATNRSAAGLVGICLGVPELVRFGLEGFWKFVDGWFLEDGMSSESPGYGFMTLNGIRHFGDAVHGYSDPPNYEAKDGRIDHLDVYGNSRYRSVLDGYVKSLMPDLGYGVPADDSTGVRMSVDVADLIASRYGMAEHVSLLNELCDNDLETHGSEYGLFHRDPEIGSSEDLALSDQFFPALRIGLLRTGNRGRASTALISASDWGGHHHEDSLNLVYWKDGHEALTDLGYLWDRPDKKMTVRTIAHNTVIVNGEDQRREGRGGNLLHFDAGSRVKWLQVSSEAYEVADEYTRLCAIIDHGNSGSYLLDSFLVAGGEQHEYLFHGPVQEGVVHNLQLQSSSEGWQDLKDISSWHASQPWSVSFELGRHHQLSVYSLPDGDENTLMGNGWGERGTGSRDNIMTGETVPYIVRQRRGPSLRSRFLSLFDVGRRSKPFVWEVQRLSSPDGTATGFHVTTEQGSDVVILSAEGQTITVDTPEGTLETNGTMTAFSLSPDGSPAFGYLYGGSQAKFLDTALELDYPVLEGRILDVHTTNEESYYQLDMLDLGPDPKGLTLLVQAADYSTGYPILHVERQSSTCLVYTKIDGIGYDARKAKSWKIIRSVLA